jgi:catechol 2,3-dioxygenase-like lactoylglutathione lyase family enzyme
MKKVILGNHMAVFAAPSERERIRRFYCDILGAKANIKSDDVDRIQLGESHFCFVYKDTALDESEFLRATYLELKTNDTEGLKRRILSFGVKTLDVPDVHLYFQAPGGQVFRIVGIDENLTHYEQSQSALPGVNYEEQKA